MGCVRVFCSYLCFLYNCFCFVLFLKMMLHHVASSLPASKSFPVIWHLEDIISEIDFPPTLCICLLLAALIRQSSF